jgi:hypothetical protein
MMEWLGRKKETESGESRGLIDAAVESDRRSSAHRRPYGKASTTEMSDANRGL